MQSVLAGSHLTAGRYLVELDQHGGVKAIHPQVGRTSSVGADGSSGSPKALSAPSNGHEISSATIPAAYPSSAAASAAVAADSSLASSQPVTPAETGVVGSSSSQQLDGNPLQPVRVAGQAEEPFTMLTGLRQQLNDRDAEIVALKEQLAKLQQFQQAVTSVVASGASQ